MNATGHIRKRETKKGEEYYQIIVETPSDQHGKRNRIYRSVQGTRKQAEALLRQTILDPLKLQENEAALHYIAEEIRDQKIRVKRAEEALERARLVLQEYRIERRTHEQLKEAAFEEFKEELAKEESKEVDELVSYVYGRRGREEGTEPTDGAVWGECNVFS